MKIIDTHSHVLISSYDSNLKDVIENINLNNMISFNIAFNISTSKEVLNLFEKNKNLIPVIGIHPNETKGWNIKMLNEIENLINDDVSAIGEIGLDYYREPYNKEEQKRALIDQIELAIKYNLPIVIHSRNSIEDCYEIIKNYPNQKFLLHSWEGDKEWTLKFIEISKNIYFSYNGIITFKNALLQREVIKTIPIKRLMFETDCPYLSPERGQINHPWKVKEIIKYIAKHLDLEYDYLKKINFDSALSFYNVKEELLK